MTARTGLAGTTKDSVSCIAYRSIYEEQKCVRLTVSQRRAMSGCETEWHFLALIVYR